MVITVCLLVFLYAGNLLRTLTAGISRMARGEMDAEGQSANLARRDELGELARAIRFFADKESERERLAQQSAAEQAARTARAEQVESLISAFRDRAQDLLTQVARETGQMEKTAADMSSLAVTTRDQTRQSGRPVRQRPSQLRQWPLRRNSFQRQFWIFDVRLNRPLVLLIRPLQRQRQRVQGLINLPAPRKKSGMS